jgi:hypothetical protein
MGMSNASSVSLTSLSAAQEIRAIQTITWLLGIKEAEYAILFYHFNACFDAFSSQRR